ncbi:calpain-D [Dichotomopilus funicola]|uniref:Calpain-D n=1 Tax=Dichotomopilus funicola TaxID=1934379 RepID=A0AAN6ZLT7_9PEZI|nr:calpain-D [Dichotomopilus funicola]
MYGYSSSSESDDYYNYRKHKGAAPAPANPNDANKKKKKRKAPPQYSINRIWKRFSNKRFNKALSVLPFDPVLPPTISDRSNELLSAGYERAAEECRRKVRKIIQECRRVNTRYRDPGWDLDWDLKMEKGHTLNILGRTKFDLSMSSMLNPGSIVPKAVKRVHEIYEKPKFLGNISGSDVKQGNIGDCWLMSSLSGLANVKDGIHRICVEHDTRIGIYGFVFYRDGEWIYSIVDDKLFLKSPCWDSPSLQRDLLQQIDREDVERVYRKTYQTGSKALFFGQCKDQNETWVPLFEKAYAKAHGDYASLGGGWIGEGLEDLSGGVTTELLASDILDIDGFWDNELSKVNEEFLFGCSTGLLDGGYGQRDGIEEGHAYVVMEARTLKDGTRLVKLRNPWGTTKKGIWEGAWSDGSKEWTTEVQEELGHQFGSDSVFWISYDDMLRKYQHFDRTRLFRDPDWRCCQRWIGVDVEWKPQYHEKFHIKLTREGPLVIVLSQLDNRYFKGLHGQYYFRLHFRIHEQDRPDPEDYIVRSHGNYLMSRSVSIELPSMLPGTYSVFISVAGERNTDVPSIEDVVKRECKKRIENEKLAQVGYAYDLAHSKASAHLEAVKRARKRADQKKASDARQSERHRLWDKRHLNRQITKKQGRKNNQKLEAKQAAREEKKRKAEESKPKDRGVQTDDPKEREKEEKEKAAEAKDDAKSEDKKEAKDDTTKVPSEAADKSSGKTDEKLKEADEKSEDKQSDKAETDKAKTDAESKKEEEPAAAGTAVEDSPDGTPIATPVVTPVVEKTAAQMSEKSTPAEAASEDKKEESSKDVSAEGPKAVESKSDEKSNEKSQEKPDATEAEKPASSVSSDSSSSGSPTPKSDTSSTPSTEGKDKEKVPVPPVNDNDPSKVPGGPPPPPSPTPSAKSSPKPKPATPASAEPDKKPANMYVTSEGESSASPISDWEELYSSDDMSRKPRMAAPAPPNTGVVGKYYDETEDEDGPDPWNAIAVVGLRVYSKDEDLELRVVIEGGELEEDGMGEKGGVDLDNAQANAGGARTSISSGSKAEKKDEDAEAYEGDSEVDKTKKEKKKRRESKASKTGGDKSEAETDKNKKESRNDKTGGNDDDDDKYKTDDGRASYPVIVQKGKGEDEYETAVETMLD